MMSDLRVVFMGTPDFAVSSLRALVEAGANVVAVVTAEDKPIGRGRKLQSPPVKRYAKEQGIPILQPPRLKRAEFLEELASYKADLQIVVAFRMLPEVVWNMPRLGSVNLHASLLPDYRGAAPINWVLINGEQETGVTTFFIRQEIDTGSLIYQERVEIGPDMNAGELHDELMEVGAELVVRTVKAIESGDYPQMEQDHSKALNPAPKIFKDDCRINWQADTAAVLNFIRGLSPYPAAWTLIQDQQFKIYKAASVDPGMPLMPGNMDTDNRSYLRIGTADGAVEILELQMQGKKRMPIADFLNGFSFNQ